MGSTLHATTSHEISRSIFERRRSQRVRVRIPLLLADAGSCEQSWTIDASDTGALVTSSHPIAPGQRVTLYNVTTGLTAVARVAASLLSTEPEASFRLALQLESHPDGFWGPLYESETLTLH